MHTLVFCSFKGGTAKTSSALHIASSLVVKHKKRVLLIDFDSQANLSASVGINPDSLNTIVSVLKGEKNIKEVIQNTFILGLDIVPSNAFLDGIETTFPLVSDLYAHEKLKKFLNNLDYDFCFIDTPPSLGWLTQSAFYAANYSIICAIPEPYSILALNRLKKYHIDLQEKHSLSCAGVILSFWDDRGATNDAFIQAIDNLFPSLLFTSRIRRDILISRSILLKTPLNLLAPNSRGCLDYETLALEFLKRFNSK